MTPGTDGVPRFLRRTGVEAPEGLRANLHLAHYADEAAVLESLLPLASFTGAARARIATCAGALIEHVRAAQASQSPLDALLHEYDLSSEEGVILMCLAEALLRIPDADTADRLIRDKLGGAHWDRHLGHGQSLLVNASTWGLLLTGRLVQRGGEVDGAPSGLLKRLVARSGEPVIRRALTHGMHIMAHQFVMGRSIAEVISAGY